MSAVPFEVVVKVGCCWFDIFRILALYFDIGIILAKNNLYAE